MNAPNVNRESNVTPEPTATPEATDAGEQTNESSTPETKAEATPKEGATPSQESESTDSDDSFNELVAKYQQKYFSDLTGDKPPPDQSGRQATPSEPTKESVLGEVRDELRKFTQAQATGESSKQDPQLVDFFAKGDFKGAEDYLQEKAYQRVMAQMEDRFAQTQNQILERAMTGIQAKMSLDTYLNGIMSKSPEVAEFRDFVEHQAETMIQTAQQQGRITSVQDYVEAKQAAYATTVKELKRRLTGARGKGKEEALKVKEKTLTSTPVSQGNPSDRSGSESTKGEPSMKSLSVSDYIAARRDTVAKQRGL